MTIIDEARITSEALVSDVQFLCDVSDENENAVTATGEKSVRISGVVLQNKTLKDLENPFAEYPRPASIVKISYDTYEVVLQVIAVSLLLLDLFILEGLKRSKLKTYHILALILLVVATVVTVVMGYFQVLEVLGAQSFAWASCGSFNLQPLSSEKSVPSRTGILYSVFCEWVVIRAHSSPSSYLILVPSALGAALVLFVLLRFVISKYRTLGRNAEQQDLEAKSLGEASSEQTRSREKRSKPGKVKKVLFGAAISILICHCQAQQFPPKSVEVVGGIQFVANGDVLWLGGVAVASPWRCAWENKDAPINDNSSLTGIDDCFARWDPPMEDNSTGLLYGRAEIKYTRCTPPGKRCPFTGTYCPSEEGAEPLNCRSRLKLPGPLIFYRKWQLKAINYWCYFGSKHRSYSVGFGQSTDSHGANWRI